MTGFTIYIATFLYIGSGDLKVLDKSSNHCKKVHASSRWDYYIQTRRSCSDTEVREDSLRFGTISSGTISSVLFQVAY